ncbi:MAG: hypothetical protein AB1530_01120 [Candidatus Omnitrophota bacterium]
MIKKMNQKSLAFGVSGIALFIISGFMHSQSLGILSAVLLIIGLVYYSKSKGYPGWLGLLGVLFPLFSFTPIVLFIILVFMPDRQKKI